ncbi:MAG: cytochrome c oxidase accessory protein CcoG [Burkholderiales bacterium]|jgi:cytochrome c oxidase accessory protein FixG|nr:cytochrome c oxidase accessory protein CcoG [Burkholderiales bacterium]
MNDIDNFSQPTEKKSLFASRKKIYVRSVTGTFQNWRVTILLLILIVFYGVPWLTWGDRPAVLLDLAARKFYFLGVVFWPQDVIYLTALLLLSAYLLFLFTAIAGRLFCGYACPQTIYTELLMWIERKIEGDRNAQIKLDASPWSAQKIGKRAGKHLLWLLIALWSGITFVGYFVPIRELLPMLPFTISGWSLFFLLLFAAMVYFLSGLMREQVCKFMCPYARFQSVMFDRDTMIVTYDTARGEPRGVRSRKSKDSGAVLGDCVDCALCVHVCPTGIDIRNGLQYECIGCGACIDACDSVMKKLAFSLGLVRYATENAIEYGYDKAQMMKRILRPRTLVYIVILLAITVAVAVSLFLRNPLRVDVLRDRGVMARETVPGVIENVYRLQIMNTEEAPHAFTIKVEGLPGINVVAELSQPIHIAAEEARMIPVSVHFALPREGWDAGTYPITFTVMATDKAKMTRTEKSTFMVPKN